MKTPDPNEITITEGDASVQLTLQAHSPAIARGKEGNVMASSKVRIVAKASDPSQMRTVKHLLIGPDGGLREGVLGQLTARLNNDYLSLDTDSQYTSTLAPLFKGLDRLFAVLGRQKLVRLCLYPQREPDTLVFDVELSAIPDRADKSGFTRDVRHTLNDITRERGNHDPSKRGR